MDFQSFDKINPTDDMLTDDVRNSTLYDWVRSYTLVRQ